MADNATPADGIPRLGLDALDPKLAGFLKPTVERLGYLGEFFQTVGHVPEAVLQFMEYTKAVKTPLTDAENEVLALAVCSALGGDYERIQHERLSSRLGFGNDWIAAASGRPGSDASQLMPGEALLRTLALAVVSRGGNRCAFEVAAVSDMLGPQKTIAALLQITRFTTISQICNTLGLSVPVKSVFDEEE